ncbi:unnamed protein product [Mytilus coruscus]|uniref:Uncharacterized protein n=1 Tax=Mytilus coruscus TaxID=42192 RepID=A0A6J8D228_MYTCO|nr:unnamed protein product [Mytilus coruscus]
MKEKGIHNRGESCPTNKIPKIIVVDEDDGHFFKQKHERPSTPLVLNKSPRRQSVSPSPAQQCRRQSVSPSPALQSRRHSFSPLPALQSRRHSVSPSKELNQQNSKSQKSTCSIFSKDDSISCDGQSVKTSSTDRKQLNGSNYIRGRSNSTTSTSSVRSRSTCGVKSVNSEESSETSLSPESITRSKSSNDIASVFDCGFSQDFTETISSMRV